MVDVDASAILRDLHEKPERDIESRLDTSVPATQAHLRDRIGKECCSYLNEPPREKTNILHLRKQRRRSVVR